MVLLVGHLSIAASGVAVTQGLATPATVARAQTTTLPRLEDYPSTEAFSGRPAPVVLASARYGRRIERGFGMVPRPVQLRWRFHACYLGLWQQLPSERDHRCSNRSTFSADASDHKRSRISS